MTDFITLSAACRFLKSEKTKKSGFLYLEDVKSLLKANQKPVPHQAWTFIGSKQDWKRSVQPYF